jgi:hypothetical protein
LGKPQLRNGTNGCGLWKGHEPLINKEEILTILNTGGETEGKK